MIRLAFLVDSPSKRAHANVVSRLALGLVETGRIDGEAYAAGEMGLALAAIAGDARLVIDKRQLLPNQPVEQRRLADIGPADNGNRKGHK